MKLHFWLAPLLLAVSLPGWTEATTLYRWKDASGQTHFGQTPPASGDYEVMRGAHSTPVARPAAAPVSSAATEQRARDRKFLEEAEAARKAKSEAKEKERLAQAEKDQRCKTAKEMEQFISIGHARLGGDEFTQKLEAAKKDVADKCG